MVQPFSIDAMQRADWARVRTIYGEGLATGLAAFMTTAPVWTVWDASYLPFARLVARRDGGVLGWAALARVADS